MTKRKTGKKKKPGRKERELTGEMIEQIEILCGFGLTEEQVQLVIKVGHSTWHKWKKNNPAIVEAIKGGKTCAYAQVVGQLMKQINKGNVTAMIFYLKTQHRWSENNIPAVPPSPDGGKITTVDPVEAAKQYQKLMDG